MHSKVLAVSTFGMMAVVLSSIGPAARAQPQQGAPAATPAPGTIRSRRSWPARPREIQGHDQGTDAVRRSAAGNRTQSRGGRLDRGAAQELRLHEHRAHQVHVPAAPRRRTRRRAAAARGARPRRARCTAPRRSACGAATRAVARRGGQGGSTIFGHRAAAPASTTIPMRSPTRSCARSTRSRRTPGPRRRSTAPRSARRVPSEMYIVGAHMDGIGWGEAANDDGSGTALVMELARDLQRPDVADRAVDPLRALEQRGDGAQRRPGLRRPAQGPAGQGGPAGIGQVSRAEVARHDPARHDDVRPRHARPRRQGQPGAAPRGRRQHRVPGRPRRWPTRRRSSRGSSRRPTTGTRPTIRPRSGRT